MTDFFRYILFRTEAWTLTGAFLMIGVYMTQALDTSRPREGAGAAAGILIVGAIMTGLAGGVCATLWQLLRLMTGHRVPNAPLLLNAVAAARPGMLKGALIGFGICFLIAMIMTGLFILTNEKTGMIYGTRAIWIWGWGVGGAGLGASIASIGGLLKQVSN